MWSRVFRPLQNCVWARTLRGLPRADRGPRLSSTGTGPTETRTDTNRWSKRLGQTPCCRDPVPGPPRRTSAVQCESTPARPRRRSASCAACSRWPACCATPCSECPSDRVCAAGARMQTSMSRKLSRYVSCANAMHSNWLWQEGAPSVVESRWRLRPGCGISRVCSKRRRGHR